MKLICFPHAGGISGYYAFLRRASLEGVDSIELMDYPGRRARSSEKGYRDFQDCVEGMCKRLVARELRDGNYVLFGHSMGAFMAYEVGCLLQSRYGLRPFHVFISGQKPPCKVIPEHYRECESEGLDFLKRLGGVPDLILQDEDIARYFMELCVRDLRLLQSYRPHEADPLNRPMTGSVICGDDDFEVSLDELPYWKDYFTVEPEVRVVDGNHFYMQRQEQENELISFMNMRLLDAKAGRLREDAGCCLGSVSP